MARAEWKRRRVVERVGEASRQARDPESLYAGLFEALAAVMPLTSACWHLTDPATGVLTRTGVIGEPPGSFEQALELEFGREDIASMAEVMRRTRPVSLLSLETSDEPARSPRYREMLGPEGTHDELRAGFVDPFGYWGSIVLFSSQRLGHDDAELVGDLSGTVAQGLRIAMTREPVGARLDPAPGVAVLDGGDAIEAADEQAKDFLARLAAGTGSPELLPGVLYVLATQARRRDPEQPARARVRDREGGWHLLDASTLDEGPHARVAVVIQAAPAKSLVDIFLLAHGLSPRERDVAMLVVSGLPTGAIALTLHLSPWTVQDHLKAIFDKVGVRSRRSLVARLTAGLDPAGPSGGAGPV